MEDPTIDLPRDKSGSYLHLKLKRFASQKDLTMPYAKKTWKTTPHDAEVDSSPSSRSSCRQCHQPIKKGDLRMRLWLQCHKGCKNSAYFHGRECTWKYPEMAKIVSTKEIIGFDKLPTTDQEYCSRELQKLQEQRRSAGKLESSTKRSLKTNREDTSDSMANHRSKRKRTEFP